MFLDIYNVLVEKTNFAYHISLFDNDKTELIKI